MKHISAFDYKWSK